MTEPAVERMGKYGPHPPAEPGWCLLNLLRFTRA
jgi:hypothetical protein